MIEGDELISIYRMEHVNCPAFSDENELLPVHHGPRNSSQSAKCQAEYMPDYGGWGGGPPPNGDPPGHNIRPHQVCGVTVAQAPAWWGTFPDSSQIARYHRDGWRFVKYLVPATHVIQLTKQCVFDPSKARRVGTLPVEVFVPGHKGQALGGPKP